MKQFKRDENQNSNKLHLDKYYTPSELAKYCINKTFEIIGRGNIKEIIEPSAGSGTVGKVAHVLDRKFLLFEINQEYHDNIIVPRLKEYGCM